jgi:hypothetical protein
MADIRIEYPDRSPGYAEVWTDIDEGYAGMYSNLKKVQGQLPLELDESTLKRVWFLTISGSGEVRRLSAEAPELLGELERADVVFGDVGGISALKSHVHPAATRLLGLGVVRLSSRPCEADESGLVRLYPSGISGSPLISWDAVVNWLSSTLSSIRLEDVRSKLAETRAEERHAFLGATFTSPSDVFFALEDYEESLPARDPDLPPEITHVWLMRAFVPGGCIAWFPDRGWFNPKYHWATD